MKKNTLFLVLGILFFVLFFVMTYKGYDKLTNYRNSEYSSSLNQNAYVGGDAYNYIINGTHATAYFVLAVGFLISGTLCEIAYVFFNARAEENAGMTIQLENSSELPPM